MVLAIIRRMDLDCDAKLTYMEFVEAVRPVEDQPTARIKSAKARTFRKAASSLNRTPMQMTNGVTTTFMDDGDLSRAPESLSPNTIAMPGPGPQRLRSPQNQTATSASRVVRVRPNSKSLRVKPVAKKTIYGRTKENVS